jgi:hypothetical protein
MTELTEDVINNRIQICSNCNQCVYEVMPNFKVCKLSNDVSIRIVVEQLACPKDLW